MLVMVVKEQVLWTFLQVIAELLSGEEVEKIKNTFDMMDTNKNGSLTFEEFKTGLHKLGSQLTENEIQQLMEAVSNTWVDLSFVECAQVWDLHMLFDDLLSKRPRKRTISVSFLFT